jgi:hypothetical protein
MRSGVTASSDSLIQNAAVRLCEMRLPRPRMMFMFSFSRVQSRIIGLLSSDG